MLRSGEINFMGEFSGDPQVLIDAAAQDGDLEVVSTVDMGFRYVAFNERRPPFNDPAFRNALSRAVDRRLIVKAAFRGFAEPSNSVVSPALGFGTTRAVVSSMTTGTRCRQEDPGGRRLHARRRQASLSGRHQGNAGQVSSRCAARPGARDAPFLAQDSCPGRYHRRCSDELRAKNSPRQGNDSSCRI